MDSVRIRLPAALLSFCLLVFLCWPEHVRAQPSGARGDDFIYRVMAGDTLIQLSDRFTGTPDNWGTLQTINGVSDPYALAIGLELRIPFELIPQVPAQAIMTHIIGQAQVNRSPAHPDDLVNEGDTLSTSAHSFATVLLPDGTITALLPDTAVRIERLRAFMGTGLIDSIFVLDDGDLESSVATEAQGVGRYEVRTPVSITGVRGTRLRVRTDSRGARTEVLSGAAQLGAHHADGPSLSGNRGIAVTADGRILPSRTLLPAPVLAMDATRPASRSIVFDPVPGAVGYQVRVAADPAGTRPVWSETIAESPARYHTPGGGTWYVLVRAIDDLGLMSDDAVLEVDGRRVLMSGFGHVVDTGFGDAVLLTEF